MDSSGLHSQRLDHLGIVAGICNQIGLIEQIDQQIGANKCKVSVGQAERARQGWVVRGRCHSPG
jgi:hypothetical protein